MWPSDSIQNCTQLLSYIYIFLNLKTEINSDRAKETFVVSGFELMAATLKRRRRVVALQLFNEWLFWWLCSVSFGCHRHCFIFTGFGALAWLHLERQKVERLKNKQLLQETAALWWNSNKYFAHFLLRVKFLVDSCLLSIQSWQWMSIALSFKKINTLNH